jgi:hypothetical protein
MAVFYASVCTTACAIGVCPDQTHQTSGHDCESAASHHSHQSSTPGKPDCSKHAHPSPLFLKSAGVPKIDLSVSSYLNLAVAVASPRTLSIAKLNASDGSDLAPPLGRGVPLYHQISVLRI